ncbi:MAG: hypothetical protein K6F91_02200 [Ruminococcus sp.]|nr:hypothetical protein [Ruminococcus sp.]
MNFENIRLEKELYGITGKSFTKALTELDPDENYVGTPLEGLDAFERQLKRFDIKVSGADCDLVEKFFATTESSVLFPEYVSRQIKQGLDENSILPEIAAAVSYIDSIDFRAFSISESGTDTVAEGGTLASTTMTLANTSTRLSKYARRLICTYESLRKQRIEAFGVALRTVGAHLSRSCNALATNVLETNITPTTIAGNSITYADLATFWASMTDANMDIMLCSPSVMANILALTEMKGTVADLMKSGRAVTPFGVTLIKCPSLTSSGDIIGIDSTMAAEVVFDNGVIVDVDKILTSQHKEVACSVHIGIAKVYDKAIKVLKTVR